jgi:hypothetical protein
MGVAGSCTAGLWEESEWDRDRHGARQGVRQGGARALERAISALLNGSLQNHRAVASGVDPGPWTMDYGPPKKVISARQNRLLRNHRATGPAVPAARWSESRAILPYGRNHKATKWRGEGLRSPRAGVTQRESRPTSNERERTAKPRSGVGAASPRLPFAMLRSLIRPAELRVRLRLSPCSKTTP